MHGTVGDNLSIFIALALHSANVFTESKNGDVTVNFVSLNVQLACTYKYCKN